MDLRHAPALVPAAACLLGTWLGGVAIFLPAGAVVALGLLGIALGRRAGWVLAALALGLLSGHLRLAPGPDGAWPPDPDRPVAARVEVVGHARRSGDGWSAPVEVVRLAQGRRVRLRPLEAYLRLPAAGTEGGDPAFGTCLRVRGYLSRPAPLGNDPPSQPGAWRLRVKSRRLLSVVAPPGPVDRLAGLLRRRLEATLAVRGRGGGLGVPLARALILGDSEAVPPRVLRGLRRLGLAHLLSVSGLHVGLVAGIALVAGGLLPEGLRGRAAIRRALALAAVLAYLLAVGPRPSLVRASLMLLLLALALTCQRPPSVANALGLAAAGIALVRPASVSDLGFRLTVGATAGLILLGPLLARAWLEPGREKRGPDPGGAAGRAGRLRRALLHALAASAGAELGTLPWALPAFGLVSPAAPLINLVAVPWAGVVLAASFSWLALASVSPRLGGAALPALDLLAAPFGWPAGLAPSPWASLPLALGPWQAALLAAALFAALRRPRRGLPLVAAGLAWTVLGSAAPGSGGVAPSPRAVMIDVGQGDSILLRDGPETLLVDGGGWRSGDIAGRVLVPVLARMGLRRLDRVLLTHPDRDHCGGLVAVAGYLEVGEAVTGPFWRRAPCARELVGLPGLRHRVVAAGDRLEVGRWHLRVLHPGRARDRGGAGDDNDASLVVSAEVFGRRLLLTGDVEAPAEAELVARFGTRGALASDVLKVAHHGSRTSTTGRFLDAVGPRLALISAGRRNPYGHPAEEVLDRLRAHRVQVLRTDLDGMIVVDVPAPGRLHLRLPGAPVRVTSRPW